MVPNRNRRSLYQDAKASFKSLVGQSAIVFVGLIVILLLTGGKPSGFIVGLSFVVGVGFVAWCEAKRLIELDLLLKKQQRQIIKFSINYYLKKFYIRVAYPWFIANRSFANLSRANLYGANLSRANLYGANLSRANLYGANLRRAKLSFANLIKTNLSDANLSDAILSGANLYGAYLSDAILSGANLYGAYLSDAILSDADLSGANLIIADLSGANLRGTIVENARFSYNQGIDGTLKQDLIRRGAIFLDSPGDRSNIETLR